MPIVFPKENNKFWPLPPDYDTLVTEDARRQARVNAASLGGTPELEVAGWDFFRREYLYPTPEGMFYKHGVVASPLAHYQWVDTWHRYPLSCTAAPRSGAKSTILRENNLRKLFVRPHKETVVFLATQSFVTDMIDVFMHQIDMNEHLIADFGELRPRRNQGIWNHKQLKLSNGAMLTGMSIKGAALGKRPHWIWFDDVERDDSLISEPTDLIEAFKKFFFHVVYPMAEKGVPVGIIGTIGSSRRTFMYWLQHSKDPRLRFWKRNFHAAIEQEGVRKGENFWDEKMGQKWQERQIEIMGLDAFNAQYMNKPSSEQEKSFSIHPELTTWWVEKPDGLLDEDPLNSESSITTCYVNGWSGSTGETVEWGRGNPLPKKVVRPAGELFRSMKRFITVDYAKGQGDSSDYNAIHVMGLENSAKFKDTLYSLDLEVGRWKMPDLTRRIYQLAKKWQVSIVGIEAYPVQMQFYEQAAIDLPELFGRGEVVPRVMPIRIPTKLSKPEKILGLEWRFRRFKVKLPLHRATKGAYKMLWYQIENFTEDLALLRYDDALDTLAMHQWIGKSRGEPMGEESQRVLIWEKLKNGDWFDENGIPYISGVNMSQIPPDVLLALQNRRWEEAEETAPLGYGRWR